MKYFYSLFHILTSDGGQKMALMHVVLYKRLISDLKFAKSGFDYKDSKDGASYIPLKYSVKPLSGDGVWQPGSYSKSTPNLFSGP